MRNLKLGTRKEKRLTDLKEKVDQLFDINIKMIYLTQELLENSENDVALKIIDLEEVNDQKQQEIIVLVTNILITEQPKASDLRLILGIFAIANELEIIGDYYKKLAKNFLKTELTERKHQKMVNKLIRKSEKDLEETKIAFDQLSHDLACSIARNSEDNDLLTRKFTDDINHLLIDANNYDEVKALTRVLNISRYFERTFAHLIVICEQISYIVNGQVFHYV